MLAVIFVLNICHNQIFHLLGPQAAMALAGLALLAMALRSHRAEGRADPARSAPAATCADSPPVQEDRGGAKPRSPASARRPRTPRPDEKGASATPSRTKAKAAHGRRGALRRDSLGRFAPKEPNMPPADPAAPALGATPAAPSACWISRGWRPQGRTAAAMPRTAQTGPSAAMGGGGAIAVIWRRVRAAASAPPAPRAGQIPQSRTPRSQAAAAWPRRVGNGRSAADGGDSSTSLIGRAIGAAAPSLPEPGAARHSQPLLAAGQRWWHAPQRQARLRAPQAGRWRREAPQRCADWCSGQPSSCCWRPPWSATSRRGGSSGSDSVPSPSM